MKNFVIPGINNHWDFPPASPIEGWIHGFDGRCRHTRIVPEIERDQAAINIALKTGKHLPKLKTTTIISSSSMNKRD
jgi:hypothetical protein